MTKPQKYLGKQNHNAKAFSVLFKKMYPEKWRVIILTYRLLYIFEVVKARGVYFAKIYTVLCLTKGLVCCISLNLNRTNVHTGWKVIIVNTIVEHLNQIFKPLLAEILLSQ